MGHCHTDNGTQEHRQRDTGTHVQYIQTTGHTCTHVHMYSILTSRQWDTVTQTTGHRHTGNGTQAHMYSISRQWDTGTHVHHLQTTGHRHTCTHVQKTGHRHVCTVSPDNGTQAHRERDTGTQTTGHRHINGTQAHRHTCAPSPDNGKFALSCQPRLIPHKIIHFEFNVASRPQ